MIPKVESALPNSRGEVELPHQAPTRSDRRKPGQAQTGSGEPGDDSRTATENAPLPLRPRHLGLRLDLIA